MNQNVIASNIANADTPGYRAKRIEFEQALRDALQVADELPISKTNSKHVGPRASDPVFPEIYEDPNGIESLDGNTVNRSEEMARMKSNQLMSDASVEMIRKKLGMLKYAISEGGR